MTTEKKPANTASNKGADKSQGDEGQSQASHKPSDGSVPSHARAGSQDHKAEYDAPQTQHQARAPVPAVQPGGQPLVQPPVDKAKLMKFRLLPGVAKHEGQDYTQEPDVYGNYPKKTFEQGDVVYSLSDLTKKLVNKFERMHSEDSPLRRSAIATTHSVEAQRELEKLSDGKLQQLADNEEIDLSKCKTREERIETIQAALNPK